MFHDYYDLIEFIFLIISIFLGGEIKKYIFFVFKHLTLYYYLLSTQNKFVKIKKGEIVDLSNNQS